MLSRTVVVATDPLDTLSPALALLCPGSQGVFLSGSELPADRVLFLDLETTGLSGGAGTVAFLAATARLRPAAPGAALELSQLLLLDFPGEGDFLAALLERLGSLALPPGGAGPRGSAAGLLAGSADSGIPSGGRGAQDDATGGLGTESRADGLESRPVLCTYNGTSFDLQILRNRLLMNAERPPELPHLDLVYPARRLWRSLLADCSLSRVEREVLGLERGDDLPGSEAPEAWFSFLRFGELDRLEAICDHNLKDLVGLARLLATLDGVVRDPLSAVGVDPAGLAFSWLAALRVARRMETRAAAVGAGFPAGRDRSAGPELYGHAAVAAALAASGRDLASEARFLLERAAAAGNPRAAYVLGRELSREGDYAGARPLFAAVVGDGPAPTGGPPAARGSACEGRDDRPPGLRGAGGDGTAAEGLKGPAGAGLRGAAYRALAIDAERRLGDPGAALAWTLAALELEGLSPGARSQFELRRARLEGKLTP